MNRQIAHELRQLSMTLARLAELVDNTDTQPALPSPAPPVRRTRPDAGATPVGRIRRRQSRYVDSDMVLTSAVISKYGSNATWTQVRDVVDRLIPGLDLQPSKSRLVRVMDKVRATDQETTG